MTPEQLAQCGTEHGHQSALFCWAAQNQDRFPELKWMYAIPNGGERNVAVAAKLRAEGVRAGVSDVCLPIARGPFHGFYIEMKKPGGKESDKQKEFGAFLVEQGYHYECCDHWEIARDMIEWYMSQ
jgi:hypothetical protein